MIVIAVSSFASGESRLGTTLADFPPAQDARPEVGERLDEPDRLKLEAPPDDAKHCRSGAGSAIFFQAPYLSLVSRAQTPGF